MNRTLIANGLLAKAVGLCLVTIGLLASAANVAQAQRYVFRGTARSPISSAYPSSRFSSSLYSYQSGLPGSTSRTALYRQYSPSLNGRGVNYPLYGVPYTLPYAAPYTVPDRYLNYYGPGSASRLYYYGGIYRTPSRLYPSGSRIYGNQYNTYASPYGLNRPAGGTILSVPLRIGPRVRYQFVQ